MKFYKEIMLICTMIVVMGQVSATTNVTISINNSTGTGYPNGVGLDKWNIIITSTSVTSIGASTIQTGYTNSSGMAVFNLSDGSYYVGAISYKGGSGIATPNYTGGAVNGTNASILTVPGSTTAEINNFSKSGAVRGYVKTSSGSGINGAKVYVEDLQGTSLPFYTTTWTSGGSAGYYSVFLTIGNYTLEIKKSGYVTKRKNVTVTKGYGSVGSEYYNINLSKTTTTSSSSGGGGGGGGAASSFDTYIKDVSKDGTSSLDIDDEDILYIIGLSLTAKQDIYSSRLSITNLDEKKPWSSMEEPDANVYRYFKVSYDKNNNVENARLNFRVTRSWLEDNDISQDTVRMYRYITIWDELDTEFIKEDDKWAYFRADTPGFSYFSVGGVNGSGYSLPVEEEEETTAPVEGEIEVTTTTTTLIPTVVTLPPTAQPPTTTPPQIPLPETDRSWVIWAAIGLVFVLAVILFVNNMKE